VRSPSVRQLAHSDTSIISETRLVASEGPVGDVRGEPGVVSACQQCSLNPSGGQAHNCFNGPPPTINPEYGQLSTEDGQLDPGRATSVTACILPGVKGGARASCKKLEFPGFDSDTMDRTNLLPRAFGGSGGRQNIVPFGWSATRMQ
jgi:hypothetical protein